jgi:hypothetical protein
MKSLKGHEPDDDPGRVNAGVSDVKLIQEVDWDEFPKESKSVAGPIILIDGSRHGAEPLIQIGDKRRLLPIPGELDQPEK